jgi:uridylate kinase
MGEQGFGIDVDTPTVSQAISPRFAHDGRRARVVIGGGNIFRGVAVASKGMATA